MQDSWFCILFLISLHFTIREIVPVEINDTRKRESISEGQINCIVNERNQKQIKINCQFSVPTAGIKLNNRYTAVNRANQKFKIT